MFFSIGRTTVYSLCLLAFCFVWPASGSTAVVTYNNRTDWVNALKSPGATTDTFAGLSGNQTSPMNRTGYSIGATGGAFRAATNTNGTLPSQPYIVATSANATITFTLTTPQTAFALQALQVQATGAVASRTNVAGDIVVTLDGVPLQQSTNGPVFFGFTSTSPFTTVTLSRATGSGAPAFDTVEFGRFTGEVLPVPEPSAVATTGLIAVAAIFAARRRRAAVKSAVVTAATQV